MPAQTNMGTADFKLWLCSVEMLVVRAKQLKVFEEAAQRRFEDEMVAHSKVFSPRLCEVIGEEQLRVAVRYAISRADGYGFTYRGPIRLFIEMMFLLGSAFDTDPQYPAFGAILRDSGDQMQRAEQIHEGFLDYLEKVSGPNAVNVHKALSDLLALAQEDVALNPRDFVAGMLQGMTRVYPQKAAYVGQEGLRALIHEGRTEARRYGISTVRGEGLVAILLYAFGHGCIDGPLYPWISQTLKDEKIVDPEARAERLERKAVTWLRHVVARNSQRAQT